MIKVNNDKRFQNLTSFCWIQLLQVANDEFRKQGRGVIRMEAVAGDDPSEEPALYPSYVVDDMDVGMLKPDIAELIRNYDPKWEFVIQYVRKEGRLQPIKLLTPGGEECRLKVWVFEKLAEQQQEVGGPAASNHQG